MASEIKVDTISEKTSAGGVTIDGLLIKDGGISGDVTLAGTTPTFTIGDAGAEDATLLFDGNAQDFYIALDDSADDLLIGLGSTVGTTPAISIDENLAIKTYGDITMTGTTPTLTIGDAGAEDTALVFDGNAQDFYIGLDDSADDLVIGLGSSVGTTPAISINEDRDVTISDGAIDFDIASHDTSNGLKLGGTLVTATAAELNIMDGVTSTAAEINLIDGGTSRGTTAVASGDGILINDGGTMRMTNVDTVSTYFASHSVGGSSIVTVGTIGTGTWQGTAIASGYIAADAITGAKIADDAIDSEHYTDGSIDNAHIADDQIDSEHYVDGSIDTAHLAADVVTGAKIADDAIDSEHYTDGSIDNAHIADDAIDSEHYAAGSIDTAHLADDQVTLAKMAGLARGKLIYGNASGNPTALAVGSADQVLTHDGTDLAWADSAGGGSLVRVGGGIVSGQNSADVSFDFFTSTYAHYFVTFWINKVNDDGQVWMRLRDSSGYNTGSNYKYAFDGLSSSNDARALTSDGDSKFRLTGSTTDNDGHPSCVGNFYIYNPYNSARVTNISGFFQEHDENEATAGCRWGSGTHNVTESIVGFGFLGNAENIELYNVQVYGLADS